MTARASFADLAKAQKRVERAIGSLLPDDHVARYQWAIERLRDAKVRDLVVEIGCGGGQGLAMLEEAGFAAVGMERNPMAVEFCKSRQVDAWVCEYPVPLLAPCTTWGAAVMLEVIEHSLQGMAMLRAAMRDALVIVASVPYNEPPGENEYHYLHHLTEESFKWMSPAPTFHRIPQCPDSLLIDWRR